MLTLLALVYLYQGGDYRLADIVEFFQLGKLVEAGGADEAVLVLSAMPPPMKTRDAASAAAVK